MNEFHLKQNKHHVLFPNLSPKYKEKFKNIRTSSNSDGLLQDAYIQLQGQLGGGAQKSLDH